MRGIGNIIVGVVFVVGGLSGQLVFIGTNSSGLLVMVGVGIIIWGVIQMAKGDEGVPNLPTVKVGDHVVVNQEAVVYTEMDSRSTPITNLVPGSKVEIVAASEINEVQWLCVKLPDEQQGYILGYKVQ